MTIGGTPGDVTVTKTLYNSGAIAQPYADTVVLGAANKFNVITSVLSAATCVAVPTNGSPLGTQTGSIPAAGSVVLTFTFTVTCTDDSFAIFLQPQIIVLTWADILSSTDGHIIDSPPASPTTVNQNFWNKKPFTPSYTLTIDDTALPAESATLPAADNCKTNGTAFPSGIYCEMYSQFYIPNANPSGTPSEQPVAGTRSTIPIPAFTIASGHPALGGVANGTLVADFNFALGFLSGSNCIYPAIGAAASLYDGALPDYTAAVPSTAVPTWDGAPNGMPPEGPEDASAAALFNALVWPT
ncbi:MAG: hypothetical protein AAB092_02525, partial [Chloroflexota bacterium]